MRASALSAVAALLLLAAAAAASGGALGGPAGPSSISCNSKDSMIFNFALNLGARLGRWWWWQCASVLTRLASPFVLPPSKSISRGSPSSAARLASP